MKKYEVIKLLCYGDLESTAVKSIGAVQSFCREENVFIEDLYYEAVETWSLKENDHVQGLFIILSLELDTLQQLKAQIQKIIEKNTEGDYAYWGEIEEEVDFFLDNY